MPRLTHRLETFLGSPRGQRILNRFYSWGAAFVILGALFKLLHIRYGDEILLVSMLTEFVVFFISGFEKPTSTYAWEKVFPELASAPAISAEEAKAQRARLRERLAHLEEGEASPLSSTYICQGEGELNRFSEAIDRLQEAILQLTRIGSLSSEASSTYQQLALDPDAMAKHTSDYVEQLGSLARNVTGLNALYELQLKSISSQIDTIDRINLGLRQQAELYDGGGADRPSFRQENEQLLRQLQELNQAYTRMLHALNVQISSPQAESPVR